MPIYKLKNPIIFKNGTGFTIDQADVELFVQSRTEVNFSIGQDVASSVTVQFNQVTATPIIIDNGTLKLSGDTITGSFTQTGDLSITENLTLSDTLTIDGILTAEKIESELTQSLTLFESGSTRFGDTIDDEQVFTGSLSATGSITLIDYEITEFSNDTTLADESTTAVVTEKAVKTYVSDQSTDFKSYYRKSYAHTGSFVSVSTASFTAATASAPSEFTSTSEEDFMFFLNGMMMEHDSLTVEQSSSLFLLKVNNDTIGYNLQGDDEIVAWGKFDNQYYLDFDGLTNEITTNFSGSGATPLNKTYSFWMKSSTTARNYSVFAYGSQKREGFTTNFSNGRVLMWNGSNWYTYWEDTSAQDDGEWHHWMVYNKVDTLTGSKLYVDGALIEVNNHITSGTVSNLNTQSQPLTIMSYQNNSNNTARHFEGSITNLAVYSGDKTDDATAHYNNGTPKDLSGESGLQGYWKMDEGSGTTVTDRSGEGNDGTINGASWITVMEK